MLLIVWIAVPVLCLLALGVLAYGVLGALQRLGREAQALQREAAPLLAQAEEVRARSARDAAPTPAGERPANAVGLPGAGRSPA